MENTPIFLSETRRAPLAADKVIGRVEELEAVTTRLESGDNLLLLNGLGGVGKTTLAGFYLERCGHRYHHAAWVNYTGHFRGDLVRQLRHSRALALPLPDNEEEAFLLLMEAMDALPAPNLLIVDNLNTPEHLEDVAAHRTRLPRGWKVLLTARVTSAAFDCYPIGVLSEDEAATLFRRHYSLRPGDTDTQLRELLRQTGCHTLAVELLAKTLAASPAWNLARMRGHLRERGLLHLNAAAPVSTAHSRDRAVMLDWVAAIFEVNIASLGERARLLLARLALLPAQAHDFERLARLEGCADDESHHLLAATLQHLTTNGLLEIQALSGGTTQSRATTTEGWYMHPVMQEVVRAKWPPDYDGCAAMLQVLENALDDDQPLMEALPLLPYAQAIIEHLKFADTRLARLCWTISDRNRDIGNFPEAEWHIGEANRMYEEKGDKRNIGATSERLGTLALNQGDIEKALGYFERYKALSEELVKANPDSEDLKNLLAISYHRLGYLHEVQGRLEEALFFFEKYYELQEEVFTANPLSEKMKNDLAFSYERFGSIYQKQGKFNEALIYFKKESKLFEELYAANPRSESLKNGLAVSYFKLGDIYQAQGKMDEALAFFEKYNKLREELYAANPRSENLKRGLAVSYERFGSIYQKQGKFDEALAFFEKETELFEELYAANPRSERLGVGLGISYIKLAQWHKAQNNPAQALHFYRKGLALYEQWYAVTRRPDVGGWIEGVRGKIAELEG